MFIRFNLGIVASKLVKKTKDLALVLIKKGLKDTVYQKRNRLRGVVAKK